MRFEIRPTGNYHPVHEGVDFLQVRLGELAIRSLERAECWIVVEEDDTAYEQQVHQENTIIETNTIENVFDRLCIRDERDDEWWVYYREDLPEFDKAIGQLAVYAQNSHTMYPTKDMVKTFLSRTDREIEDL